MRRVGAGLLAAVLALAGCKHGESKPTDKGPAGLAASKTKGKDDSPDWLAGIGKLPGGGTDVPKAGTWAKPGDPNFNTAKESQGVIAGRVLDPFGRPVNRAFIKIELADTPPKPGAPTGIQTKQDGYFMTQGLTPGAAYTLTAEVQQEGKTLVGVVQAKAPAPNLTIQLRDDMLVPSPSLPPGAGRPGPAPGGALPPAVPASPGSGAALPQPSSDLIPPMGLNSNPTVVPSVTPRPADGAWSPGGAGTAPIPPTLPGTGTPGPASPMNTAPTPGTSDPPVTRPVRPENIVGGPPDPFRPPAVSIPGPPVPPVGPTTVPPIPPPKANPGEKQSSLPVRPGANFALVDTLERPWDFATSRHGSLVLLDFMTTSCIPCKQSIPVLADLQSRYGAEGLQLAGVVCDDAPLSERAARAARYHQANNLNYALFVEPGTKPGVVRERFQVESYPTAVLLDETGSVVWKGHPSAERAALEAAIRSRLGK
ncbi:MAG TPA: redoxin domain-containing protein [Gemmataceae bacterium]|nr:redoxin domain-containing protein [Gemmataceae bacterium]